MSKKYQQQFAEPEGGVIFDSAGNRLLSVLGAAPTAGASGYTKGGLFVNTAGSAGTLLYVNTGSATSATWTNIV